MSCLTPFILGHGHNPMPVPCGKCPSCRLARAQGWIFRLTEEEQLHSTAYFVTLTYDPDHCVVSSNGFPTLVRKHVQLFMKSLRNEHVRRFGTNRLIKYYAAGEYGGKTRRPHYHLILMGSDIDCINAAWPHGHVDIGSVTSASICYVTKYMMKPATVPAHGRDDRVKEFSFMSKGIGLSYVNEATMKFHTDDLTRNYVVEPGGVKVPMPRYYRNRFFTESDREYQHRVIVDASFKRFVSDVAKHKLSYPDDDLSAVVSVFTERKTYKLDTDFVKHQKNRDLV
jgi:hypothetical protein